MQSLATDGTTLWSAELYWNGARIRKITIGTGVVGQINTQQWAALLYTGGKLFASQNGAGIYTVDTGTGAQTRVAGGPNVWDTGCQDGTAFNARFGLIRAMDSDGTYLYAADTNCNAIRRIKLSDYSVTTISGSFSTPPRDLDGSLGTALFYAPTGLVITTQGTFVGNSYGIRLMH
jgi:outer membrane protein assembly factor BamB